MLILIERGSPTLPCSHAAGKGGGLLQADVPDERVSIIPSAAAADAGLAWFLDVLASIESA